MKHPLPVDALDSDIAILGRKGGGKTVTAKGIVERLIKLKRRVLIIDVLGNWWGLKAAADGKAAGLPIAIFGGDHADRPLDYIALSLPLANMLATENIPAILDIADMPKANQIRFLLAFLRELRRVNREPLTVVLEEGDVFAPQNPLGDDSKELHAEIDWIARRGRARGFRLITVCQRPARLSKDVLTQAATLIAHVMPGEQDRTATVAWFEGQGDKKKGEEVKASLGTLRVGEAWLCFSDPEHGIFRRVQFPMIETFDSTKTPKAGERVIEPKTLAQVDMTAIDAALEKAKEPKPAKGKSKPTDFAASDALASLASNPKVKRLLAEEYRRGAGEAEVNAEAEFARGLELGRALATAQAFQMARSHAARILDGLMTELERLAKTVLQLRNNDKNAALDHGREAAKLTRKVEAGVVEVSGVVKKDQAERIARAHAGQSSGLGARQPAGDGGVKTTVAQRTIDAIAEMESFAGKAPPRSLVALAAGYGHVRSTGFAKAMSGLRTEGLISYPDAETVTLTTDGRQQSQDIPTPTPEELHARVSALIGGVASKILSPLIESYPHAVDRSSLAAAAGYEHVRSTGFAKALSRMSKLGIIECPDAQTARAAAALFPDLR